MGKSGEVMYCSAFDQGRKQHDGNLSSIGSNTVRPNETGGDIVTTIEPVHSTGEGKSRRVSLNKRKIASACLALRIFAVAAFTSIIAFRAPDVRADVLPTYSIDVHVITAGGTALRDSCFHLSGTLAQPAPGYSASNSGAPMYSVYAGFWSAMVAMSPDAVFFTGFEEC
jgi:hypothetical protein